MKAFPPCRFSPDDSRTGVNIGTFPAFLQAIREVWTVFAQLALVAPPPKPTAPAKKKSPPKQ
jgi:hypothetical protein